MAGIIGGLHQLVAGRSRVAGEFGLLIFRLRGLTNGNLLADHIQIQFGHRQFEPGNLRRVAFDLSRGNVARRFYFLQFIFRDGANGIFLFGSFYFQFRLLEFQPRDCLTGGGFRSGGGREGR